jgi:hypothetical protein
LLCLPVGARYSVQSMRPAHTHGPAQRLWHLPTAIDRRPNLAFRRAARGGEAAWPSTDSRPKLGAQPLNRPAPPDVPVSQVGLQRGEAKLGQAGLAALPDHPRLLLRSADCSRPGCRAVAGSVEGGAAARLTYERQRPRFAISESLPVRCNSFAVGLFRHGHTPCGSLAANHQVDTANLKQ